MWQTVVHEEGIKSDADLYWWSACFLAKPERRSGVKNDLRFFGDDAIIPVLEAMEDILMSFHKSHIAGSIIERVDGDVNNLANFFSNFAVSLAINLVLVGGIILLLGRLANRYGNAYFHRIRRMGHPIYS